MAVLSRADIEKIKEFIWCQEEGNCDYEDCEECPKFCPTCPDDLIETIEHLQAESDRRKLEHEKARRAVEVLLKEAHDKLISTMNVSVNAISKQAEKIKQLEGERDRLKSFKPFCFDGKDKCAYMAIGEGGEPTETCKNCHWCEAGYEALGEVEAE